MRPMSVMSRVAGTMALGALPNAAIPKYMDVKSSTIKWVRNRVGEKDSRQDIK